VSITITRGTDPAATDRILRALPDWFGIESAIVDYVADSGRLPGYVAHAGGGVVGFALVRRHFPETAELHLLAVAPEHQRQGVGRRLLAAVVEDLADAGIRLLQVKTLGASHPSEHYARTRRFYEAEGFLPVEELPELWPGNPCLIMVKVLGCHVADADAAEPR
jgi:ribosomal protein S18 acetylase RimI-like enzyme